MTLDDLVPIDPNTANLDTLCLLPGVGPTLAKRIMAARPFETIDDLTRVQGIGAVAVERWTPMLAAPTAASEPATTEQDSMDAVTLSPDVEAVEAKVTPQEPLVATEDDESQETPDTPAEDERIEHDEALESDKLEEWLDETAGDAESEHLAADESKELGESSDQAAGDERLEPPQVLPAIRSRREKPVATRRYAGWLVTVSGLLVLILSLSLNLGILATLNEGQLKFASPAQISALTIRIEGLEAQADSLGEDLSALRTRLSTLEAMGERMSAVEQSAEELRTDLDGITAEITDLSTEVSSAEDTLSEVSEQLDDLQTEVETLQVEGDRFQTFLEGLQALMDSLFQAQGGR